MEDARTAQRQKRRRRLVVALLLLVGLPLLTGGGAWLFLQSSAGEAMIKEKVLAAHRAGIKRVLLPERNKPDLEEVPKEVQDELEFVTVARMDQVLEAALESMPKPLEPSEKKDAPVVAN